MGLLYSLYLKYNNILFNKFQRIYKIYFYSIGLKDFIKYIFFYFWEIYFYSISLKDFIKYIFFIFNNKFQRIYKFIKYIS